MNSRVLCSVLIPTRKRPARLAETVNSIVATAADPSRLEILLRVDNDDDDTLKFHGQLIGLGFRHRMRIGVTVGARGNGYADLHLYYDALARVAQGRWIHVMNDDARIVSDGRHLPWDVQLAALASSGIIVQPEIYGLNASGYRHCEGGAFPWVPNQSWRQFGHEHIGSPVDTWLDQVLHVCGGWKTHFLAGVTVQHDRDADDKLAAHRRIT